MTMLIQPDLQRLDADIHIGHSLPLAGCETMRVPERKLPDIVLFCRVLNHISLSSILQRILDLCVEGVQQ